MKGYTKGYTAKKFFLRCTGKFFEKFHTKNNWQKFLIFWKILTILPFWQNLWSFFKILKTLPNLSIFLFLAEILIWYFLLNSANNFVTVNTLASPKLLKKSSFKWKLWNLMIRRVLFIRNSFTHSFTCLNFFTAWMIEWTDKLFFQFCIDNGSWMCTLEEDTLTNFSKNWENWQLSEISKKKMYNFLNFLKNLLTFTNRKIKKFFSCTFLLLKFWIVDRFVNFG